MNRIKQPSTWAGLAGLLEVAKLMYPQYAPIIVGLQGTFGGVAVYLNEAK